MGDVKINKTVPTIEREKSDYSTKLECLIDYAGSQCRLALMLGVSSYNISNWRRRGVSRKRYQLINNAYRSLIKRGFPSQLSQLSETTNESQ